ncbi:MAG: GNAT family N-acetyltransferase [Bdellovibrionales bacterium]|nr:GNAT family N-acetyltransferase [Bdellovibrionales bacterium]
MELFLFSELNSSQLKTLEKLLNKTYWGKEITYSDLYTTVSQSSLVFAYKNREGHLVAFARVLTDFIAKAFILDFVVADEFQGLGVGSKLLDEIINCPDLKKVHHLELYCRKDVIPFYSRVGFKKADKELKLLCREHTPRKTLGPIQEI